MALKTKLPPATYVDTPQALQKMLDTIAGSAQIAVDTESNNMYAYRGQVCLIQLSNRDHDYIIDPLAIDDLQALAPLLADEKIEKIFHAAEYDLICLKRDFDFDIHNLFDTMAAARLSGAKKFGLGDLLKNHFDIKVDKSHQRDDWGKRPLPKDSLTYAQMDTHYLHELRDNLKASLTELGRLDEAQEVFGDVLRIDAKEQVFDPHGFWKIGKPNKLNRRQMALLKELYLLREDLAQEEDLPPFKVIQNQTLVNIVRKQPHDFRSLQHVRGMSNKIMDRYGDDILKAIEKGRNTKTPKQPPRDEPNAIVADRYIALHSWRKNVARKRNLDSSLILAKQMLWDLANKMPSTRAELAQMDGFGQWRLDNYGEDILNLIEKLR